MTLQNDPAKGTECSDAGLLCASAVDDKVLGFVKGLKIRQVVVTGDVFHVIGAFDAENVDAVVGIVDQ